MRCQCGTALLEYSLISHIAVEIDREETVRMPILHQQDNFSRRSYRMAAHQPSVACSWNALCPIWIQQVEIVGGSRLRQQKWHSGINFKADLHEALEIPASEPTSCSFSLAFELDVMPKYEVTWLDIQIRISVPICRRALLGERIDVVWLPDLPCSLLRMVTVDGEGREA